MAERSQLQLPCTFDNGRFARFVPFGDGREVIVRRGSERGFDYGLPQGEREVELAEERFTVTRYVALLSPPLARPGSPAIDPARFKPEVEVLRLPDAELMLPRQPDGFSDDEVAQIFAAVAFVPDESER
ncbi:MAG: hypothetical protein H6707_04160 [Deltaproteobacteria bacterium]|nr:hypothetical protein [Deltaproteobacteria bacterium]